MRYFVTGATGFVGGYLVRKLRAQGHEVVASVRTPSKAGELQEIGVELAAGDITDKASMREPMRGVDGVFHVAGWYKTGVRDSSVAYDINVTGTRNVFELMQELNIAKGVYTSTLAIFSDTHGKKVTEDYVFTGKHITIYDQSKWQAHYEVAEPMIKDGLPLVIVQPGVIYGEGDTSTIGDVVRDYLQGKLPVLPQGVVFCWAHVDDIVEGHILAMDKGKVGESYIIAGECKSLIEFFALAQEITGIPAPKIHVPPFVFAASAPLMGLLGRVLPLPPAYSAEGMRSSAGVTYMGDNSKARRELGYNPRPLKEALPAVLEHTMQALGVKKRV